MEIFNEIFRYLVDKSKNLNSKFMIIVFVIFCAIFLNNIFGFTFYYEKNKKLDSLLKLESLLKDSENSSETILYLKNLKNDILERKNILVQIEDLVNNDHEINKNGQGITRSKILDIVSSTIFLILLVVVLFFIALLNYKKVLISGVIFFELFFIGIITGISILAIKVPTLYHPIFNYILYFILQSSALLFIIREMTKSK